MRFSFFLIAVITLLSFNTESCTFSFEKFLGDSSAKESSDTTLAVNYILRSDTLVSYLDLRWEDEDFTEAPEVSVYHEIIRPYDQQVILSCTLPANWQIGIDQNAMPVLTSSTGELVKSEPSIIKSSDVLSSSTDWNIYKSVAVDQKNEQELIEMILGERMKRLGCELVASEYVSILGIEKFWGREYTKKYQELSTSLISSRWIDQSGKEQVVFVRVSVYEGEIPSYGYSLSFLTSGSTDFEKAIQDITSALRQNLIEQEYLLDYNQHFRNTEKSINP